MKSKILCDNHDYNPGQIEPYWQKAWQESAVYEPDLLVVKQPFYNLMMFPYPSAEGLHVGNMYAFCGSDIYGRFKRMQGYDVFEPIGLDGFGIHSENFALKIGQHPKNVIRRTEANFYRQLHAIGNAFDWSHRLETYDSNYYKWTQWIFIQLFKNGLAYRAKASVNWCPSCKTVLADEQVINKSKVKSQKSKVGTRVLPGDRQVCERCQSPVEKIELSQWFFKTTAYAQRLLDGLNKIDWSEKVKIAQRNWLGRSDGVLLKFSSDIERDSFIEVFTTRPDTIYGATFLALAPEHPSLPLIIDKSKGLLRQRIREYVDYSKNKSFEERRIKSKTGIKTNFHGVNPLSGEKVSIYIADYVLPSYGTGAIMGVPAHDQRDFEFAKEHGIEIIEVISGGDISRGAFTGEGILVNSDKFNGLSSKDGIQSIIKDLKMLHFASTSITWHLRDWIISRQRYWGPPIPIIYCQKCGDRGKSWFSTKEAKKFKILNLKFKIEMAGWYPVPEKDLPVELPYIKNFKPTGTGVSPLAQDPNFVKVKCPECGGEARRETDVSDTFLDSAWYFLRYPSIGMENGKWKMENFPWNPEITWKWLPVDMYIGGAEHSVLHLLYSRFLWKVFYDLGYFDFSAKSPKGQLGGSAKMPVSGWEEPFTKFRAHGLLISKGVKMSKSRGNIVTPDAYIEKYGADTLRCYLMFCGRFTQGGDFRDSGIEGMSRFLKRIWRLVQKNLKLRSFPSEKKIENLKLRGEAEYMMHKTIKRVTEDIESLDYNTAIAALMEWLNALEERAVGGSESAVGSRNKKNLQTTNYELVTREEVETLLLLLAPFAPHMTEELWQRLRAPINADKNQRISADANQQKSALWSIHQQPWPKFDPKLAESKKIVLVVEVNGRVRDKIEVDRGIDREEAEKLALKSNKVTKYLQNKRVKRVIFVPDKLINLVV